MTRTQTTINGIGLLALATIMYAGLSSVGGSPNPLRWNETFEKRARERQSYNELYNKAVECVEQDKIPGLSNLRELNDLYLRAGVNVGYNPGGTIHFPFIPKENLEKVVQGCEVSKEGK